MIIKARPHQLYFIAQDEAAPSVLEKAVAGASLLKALSPDIAKREAR